MSSEITFKDQWARARARGVPLIAVECADPAQVGKILCTSKKPVFAWDVVRGLFPRDLSNNASLIGTFANEQGAKLVDKLLTDNDFSPELLAEPITALDFLTLQASGDSPSLKNVTILFLNAHLLLDSSSGSDLGRMKIIQALYNARDILKSSNNIFCLCGSSFRLPAEIVNDIYVMTYPLPTDEERKEVILSVVKGNNLTIPDDQIITSVAATKGLTAFAVEQAFSIATNETSVDIDMVREWWKKTINSQRGLSIVNTNFTLDDIAGLDNFKNFAKKLMTSKGKPGAVVWIDEIEKAMAGVTGDNTGVSQDILGQVLTFMQEQEADGIVAVGPPGAGKSMCSAALGSAGGVPTIALDLGGLKDGIVGTSEQNIRAALRVFKALAGKTMWIASCNSLSGIKPELKRRFTYGIWYFDLPTDEEQEAMWALYRKKYSLEDNSRPVYKSWTGAEIKTICKTASQLGVPISEAAQWVVPVAEAAKKEITELREQANGKFTSASYPGPYKKIANQPSPKNSSRKLNMEGEE